MNKKFVKWALFLLAISLTSCSGCSRSGIKKNKYKQSENVLGTEIQTNIKTETNETSEDSETTDFTIGKVIAIIDGDTYDLLINGNQTVRIRMEGIDAPERGMPFYKVSKNFLGALCFNKQVKFIPTKEPDSHNRLIGFTYLDNGAELSHEMVKAGLAWHFKRFNSDQDLSELEIEARNAKLGLWSEINPMPPWKNRKLHRQGISTKAID